MGLCGGMPEEMTTGLKGKTIAVASSHEKTSHFLAMSFITDSDSSAIRASYSQPP